MGGRRDRISPSPDELDTAVRPGTGVSRIWNSRSAAARPADPEWYRMASCRRGRKNSGVMTSTASARSNVIWPSMSRRLTSTATTAVATAAPHSRTSAVWNAVRSTSIVVSPYCRLTARMVSICSRPRPNIRSVARPWSMSRKNAPSQRSSIARRPLMTRVRPPMTASSNTSTGPVSSSTSAVGGSMSSTTRMTSTGTMAASCRAGR